MKIKIILSATVFFILCYVAYKSVDFHKIGLLLHSIPLPIILLLFLISTLLLILKAVRFSILLRQSDVYISFWEIIKVSFAGQATSPLPAGEATRSILLKKKNNISYSDTSGTIVTQPLLEIIISSIITCIGTIFYHDLIIPMLILLIFICLFLFIVLHPALLESFVKKLRGTRCEKIAEKLLIISKGIRSNLLEENSHKLTRAFYKTSFVILFANVVGGFLLFILLAVFHIHISFFQCLFIYAASIVLQNLAILPGGIGTTEGGMAGLLYLSHVPFQQAVSAVLVFRFITFAYSVFIGFIFILIFYTRTLFHAKKS